MRAAVAFAVLAFAAADVDLDDKAKCVVDGGEAASDLMDAAIFIWGAKQRCSHADNQIKCEIDIASAVQSIASMSNTILKVVGRCGDDFDPDCGRASTRLVKAIAGVTSATGGIKQKCHPNFQQPTAGGAMVGGNLPGTDWMHGASALCVLDVKNTAKNLLKSIKNFVKIEHKCKHKHSRKCTSNVLKTVGALSGLGEYLAAAVGDCSPVSKTAHDAECAQESIMLVHHLTKVAEAGVEISKKCGKVDDVVLAVPEPELTEVQVARKYEEGHSEYVKSSNTNLVLGAFLPVSAIVSFAAGRLYASRRPRTQDSREFTSDHE